MDICIDFDGTCVTHEYPKVGKDIGAVPVLKELVRNGNRLILFTMRSFEYGISPITNDVQNGGLNDAINWFINNDIPLYGVNVNPTQNKWTASPKAYAQLYIDDAGIGCPLIWDDTISDRPFIDWKKTRKLLKNLSIL
jgi:hypothetical protein